MAATRQVQRLRKVAGEFNLGASTVVEFLAKKGFEVDSSPNAKITPEMYELLEKNFELDKSIKEQKEKLVEEYKGRKVKKSEARIDTPVDDDEEDDIEIIIPPKIVDAPLVVKEEKKSPTIETAIPSPKIIDKIDLDKINPKKAKTQAPVEEKLVDKVAEKVVAEEKKVEAPEMESIQSKAEPEVETKSNTEVKEVAQETPAAQASETSEELKGPKVVGRVDLSAMNQKTRPAKKTRKQRQQEEAALSKAAAPKRENNTAKDSTPDTTAPKTEAAKNEPNKPHENEGHFIKTKIQNLTGPTVVGKIELPTKRPAKKKMPVGSSNDNPYKKNDASANARKKRRRIKPDKTVTTPNANSANPANAANRKPNDNANRRNINSNNNKRKKEVKPELTEEDISKQIKETLARLSDTSKNKGAKHRRQKRDAVSQTHQKDLDQALANLKIIKVTEFVSANELASMMSVTVNEIIKVCMSLGMFVSINQRLDAETISIVAEEFGFSVEFVGAKEIEESFVEILDTQEDLKPRNPIVTIMGHVDHGKTSLLDFIRKSNVIAGEAGGITQHIGAYEVELADGSGITFLDTPGHEAFTAMRARGSKITDIAVIVIAADDSIMPQTREAITHAQAASVPIIFAINKIDKPNANPEKIKEELAQMNLLVEEWGGKYQSQDISAKTGLNVDGIMEKIILEAEMLELKANPNRIANGTVLEASLDKGKGYVSKILVQNGTLNIGDIILAGTTYGKVKAMFNERNKLVKKAGPATPVLLLGLNGAPAAGDVFRVMPDEKEARNIALRREQLQREQGVRTNKHITLDEIGRRLAIGDFKELNIIIKGDVDGSVEALSDSLIKLSTEEIQVNIIHKAVGQVNEADVMLASASDAIIVAFQVRPNVAARQLADREEIDIRTYSIIYNVIDEIKAAMEGMLSPDMVEEIVCSVEVRDVFKITKVGTVAGCYVLDGKIHRNTKIRIIRDGIVIYTGNLGSLKRFKDDVKEVNKGFECGLNIDNYNDIKVGDIIEGFEMKEVKRTL